MRARRAYRQFLQVSVEGIWRLEAVPPIPIDLEEQEQVEAMLERTRVAESNEALARRYGYASAADIVGARLDDLWQDSAGVEDRSAARLRPRRVSRQRSGDQRPLSRRQPGAFSHQRRGSGGGGPARGRAGDGARHHRTKAGRGGLAGERGALPPVLAGKCRGHLAAGGGAAHPHGILGERAQAELILERARVAEANDVMAMCRLCPG